MIALYPASLFSPVVAAVVLAAGAQTRQDTDRPVTVLGVHQAGDLGPEQGGATEHGLGRGAGVREEGPMGGCRGFQQGERMGRVSGRYVVYGIVAFAVLFLGSMLAVAPREYFQLDHEQETKPVSANLGAPA